MTYTYLQHITESEPPAYSDVSNTSNRALRNYEIYSRDVSGRELAIFFAVGKLTKGLTFNLS